MTTGHCPACRGSKVVAGIMGAAEGYAAQRFTPGRARPGVGPIGVAIAPGGFRACVSCGHVWSAVDPARLRDQIRARGDGLAREQLDDFELGPLRGLPDTEIAREVSAKVAEINALCCAGRAGEATRRFRDLAGVTWDRAIEVLRKWPDLPREEKLELFGWVAKAKVPVDELA